MMMWSLRFPIYSLAVPMGGFQDLIAPAYPTVGSLLQGGPSAILAPENGTASARQRYPHGTAAVSSVEGGAGPVLYLSQIFYAITPSRMPTHELVAQNCVLPSSSCARSIIPAASSTALPGATVNIFQVEASCGPHKGKRALRDSHHRLIFE